MSGVRNAGSRAGHDGRARDDRCSNPFQLRNEDQDSPKVQVSLDREGFALLTHRSAVTDFVDEDQLRSRSTHAPTRRDVDGRRPGKHREMTRDPDRIRQAPAMERPPESRDVAELGVRQHGRDLQPRGARVGST